MCVRCGTGKIAWCTDPNRHEKPKPDIQPVWDSLRLLLDKEFISPDEYAIIANRIAARRMEFAN